MLDPDNYTPHSPVLGFEKQLPRVKDASLHHKLMSLDDKRAISKLPMHMHTINNRMVSKQNLEKTLRETKHQAADWLEPVSTLNTKPCFRRDPNG